MNIAIEFWLWTFFGFILPLFIVIGIPLIMALRAEKKGK